MIFKFLNKDEFYNTFFDEICDVQCGKNYNLDNPQHVEWLKNFIKVLYLRGGEALCLYSDENEPIGFIYLLHDKGLENVACFGAKATIAMFEVKEDIETKDMESCFVGKLKNICGSAVHHVYIQIPLMIPIIEVR